MKTALASIGHNNPPEPTPYERACTATDSVYEESKLWLDGAVVTDQATADCLGKLLNMLRATKKTVDAARVDEKRPHDEAAAEVQERYKPLLGKCDNAEKACKAAIAKWLEKVDAEKKAESERLRAEAERKAQEAAEALSASRSGTADLESREEAERALEQAAKAERLAKKAEKSTAQASGGAGRAVGLRTVYSAEIVDISSAVWHFLATCQDEMLPAIQRLADDAVRSAGKNAESISIPGVVIHAEKKAV